MYVIFAWMMCILPGILARRLSPQGGALDRLAEERVARTNASRGFGDDMLAKSMDLYGKVDAVLSVPVAKVTMASGQTVGAVVGIARDAMAIKGKVSAQKKAANASLQGSFGDLLASFEGDLQEVLSFEATWLAIQKAGAAQREHLKATMGKGKPPKSGECTARFDKAKLSDLFCKIVCGDTAPECEKDLQADSEASTFEIEANEVKDQQCGEWASMLPTLTDIEKKRSWPRFVNGAVAKAVAKSTKLLSERSTSPYKLALDSQQALVTWTKHAYDLCVADSKWYNNPLGAVASGTRGWFSAVPEDAEEVPNAEVIEQRATQIKHFIHAVTCPAVETAMLEAESFERQWDSSVDDAVNFLDDVLLENLQKQYSDELKSFYDPVCKSANSTFVGQPTRVMSLVFDGWTAAKSGIPVGLATAAIVWHGAAQGNYSQLLQPQNAALIAAALRSFSYLAKRAADGYVTGSESCKKIADEVRQWDVSFYTR